MPVMPVPDSSLMSSNALKLTNHAPYYFNREVLTPRFCRIFAIEGIITCGLSIIAFFTLTDRPATARWLTQEEKDLAIARVKAERVGTTEVLDR
jgi:hypothetical protein